VRSPLRAVPEPLLVRDALGVEVPVSARGCSHVAQVCQTALLCRVTGVATLSRAEGMAPVSPCAAARSIATFCSFFHKRCVRSASRPLASSVFNRTAPRAPDRRLDAAHACGPCTCCTRDSSYRSRLPRRRDACLHLSSAGRQYPDRVDDQPGPRFLTVPQVAEELATSPAQIMALLKRGELVGVQIGRRGHWRIERVKLKGYVARCYEETDRRLRDGDKDEGGA
jgi:excisionase family DNA binding protein